MKRLGPTLAAFLLATSAHGREEEVSIEGQRGDHDPADPLATTSFVRGEELRGPRLQASEILRRVPGVAVRETGGFGALSTASIRGATSAQTPVYLAGIRLNDDVGGTADLSLVPVWLVRSVTVQRSGGTPTLDTSGIGGAILFDPFSPHTSGEDGAELRTEMMGGSFGARSMRVSVAHRSEGAEVIAGVHHEGATNDYVYANDRGTRFDPSDDTESARQNADVATTDVWALAEISPGERTRIRTLSLATVREQGIPGLGLFPTRRARGRLARGLFGLSLERQLSGIFTLSSTTTAIASRAAYDDPDGEAGFGTARVDQRGARIEEMLSLTAKLERTRITFGVTAAREQLDVARADGDALAANRMFGMARGAATFRIAPSVSLYAMGSIECHHTRSVGPTVTTAPSAACPVFIPAGRLGAQLTLGSVTLSANTGRYGRVPTLGETFGINGFVRGNPDLVPETGVLGEIGAALSLPFGSDERTRLGLSTFAFGRWSRDLIAYASSPLGYARPFNTDSGRTFGLEVEARLDHGPWRLHAPLTVLDARRTTEGAGDPRLPYQPVLQVAPRIERLVRAQAGPFRVLAPFVGYTFLSTRNADRVGLIVLPAQGMVDAGAAWASEGERLVVRVRGTNLLDARRYDLVGYPLPGRSLFASLETRF